MPSGISQNGLAAALYYEGQSLKSNMNRRINLNLDTGLCVDLVGAIAYHGVVLPSSITIPHLHNPCSE